MAEPARQRHTEIDLDIRPKLGVIQGGGESSPPTGDLRPVEVAADLAQQEKQPRVIQGGGESTPDRADLRSVSDQENEPIPFTGNGLTPNKQPVWGRFFGSAKKNSAVTAIIGMLLTGAFGLSLLSPGLLLVQLKETLNDKFNDQLAAMDIRQTAILKKKLNRTTTSGVCTGALTIRCKYQTIGDRHIKRLEKAGIKVVGEKNAFGRTRPTSFVFDDKPITAPQLLNEARKNPSLRSAMRHGYNPKFAAFSDAIASKVNTKLLLKKSKNITPSSDTDKMKDDLKKAASGETDLASGRKLILTEDGTGYENPDDPANPYSLADGERINLAIDEVGARGERANSVTKDFVKGGMRGALTVTAFGAGTVDSACTVWNLIRVAGFAAKIYGQRQLIRYSFEFMKTADAIKAGDATPEEVSYLSAILTTPNSEGTSALDSLGYKYAAYGDTFMPGEFSTNTTDKEKTGDVNEVKNETAKYVNGQIIPDNAMASIIDGVGGGDTPSQVDATCGFVKSWQGQTALIGLAVVGLVVGVFSGGVSVGAGTAAQIAFSVSAAVAIAAITPKLVEMAKGELITGDENGNEAGNAITSGMGGYNARASQGRGLAVLDEQDAVEYVRLTDTTVADYNEVERSELSPLDATSKNTLVGSIVNTIIPYTSKLTQSGSTLTSLTSLVTSSFGSIITPKSNADATRAEEFKQCNDPEYERLAADPFCNLRYGLSKSALATDPEEVLAYMETGGYIETNSEDGAPGGANGSEYQEYIDQCIERVNSIGDKITESSEGSGDNCIQGKSGGKEERNTMFRLFYIDMSVQDGMDSDFQTAAATSPTTDTVISGDVAWPLNKSWWNSDRDDWLDDHTDTGTAWGEDNMGTDGKGPYVAADIGDPPVGAPVYAMVGGTVTSTSLCGDNDGMAIKSTINGKTLGIAYMHGNNQLFNVGDVVQAGDHIMDLGEIGCTVRGAHLHIGMAYEGKYLCPQDVFLALDKSEAVDWGALTEKASSGGSCGR